MGGGSKVPVERGLVSEAVRESVGLGTGRDMILPRCEQTFFISSNALTPGRRWRWSVFACPGVSARSLSRGETSPMTASYKEAQGHTSQYNAQIFPSDQRVDFDRRCVCPRAKCSTREEVATAGGSSGGWWGFSDIDPTGRYRGNPSKSHSIRPMNIQFANFRLRAQWGLGTRMKLGTRGSVSLRCSWPRSHRRLQRRSH